MLHHTTVGGRKINVELTAGGGGKSEVRQHIQYIHHTIYSLYSPAHMIYIYVYVYVYVYCICMYIEETGAYKRA